jgi:transposase
MANTTISMSKIRQVLRMYIQGRSKLSIAAQSGVSRNTAKKYFAAFDASGCTFEHINVLNNKELEDFLAMARKGLPTSVCSPFNAVFLKSIKNSSVPA